MAQGDDFLDERRRSLEEEFFHRENQRLLDQLRQDMQREETLRALSEASGIRNPALLERIADLGVTPETVAALSLVPLVEVAWADGKLDDREKEAILKASRSELPEGGASYRLLESWLERRPQAKLRKAWRHYIQGLAQELDPAEREALRTDLLGRARHMAEASGGFLGLGSRISRAEAEVLDDLARAFG